VAAFALALATAPAALAQVTSETTTTSTSYNGTVNTFGPDVITVQSDSSAAPVSYSYSKTTTYVDENGNPVSVETVKSGAPVTVFYTQDGDRMIASKVVVHRPIDDGTVIEKKTTSTTTTTSPAP
jgi:hypothetical protein